MPAGEAHAAAATEEAELAKFVIAEHKLKLRAELRAQLADAFGRALE